MSAVLFPKPIYLLVLGFYPINTRITTFITDSLEIKTSFVFVIIKGKIAHFKLPIDVVAMPDFLKWVFLSQGNAISYFPYINLCIHIHLKKSNTGPEYTYI